MVIIATVLARTPTGGRDGWGVGGREGLVGVLDSSMAMMTIISVL